MHRTEQAEARLSGLIQRLGPVLTAVGSVLIIILGVLIISFPELLSWVLGIGLVLVGVALLTSLVLAVTRSAR